MTNKAGGGRRLDMDRIEIAIPRANGEDAFSEKVARRFQNG
jgi:hypothetical protein